MCSQYKNSVPIPRLINIFDIISPDELFDSIYAPAHFKFTSHNTSKV